MFVKNITEGFSVIITTTPGIEGKRIVEYNYFLPFLKI